jgi:hypothetical protein
MYRNAGDVETVDHCLNKMLTLGYLKQVNLGEWV